MNYPSVLSLAGDTPLIPCPSFPFASPVLVKLEGANPTGSLKDRVIRHFLEYYDASGKTVVAADWGPFALSAAWGCQLYHIPCLCFVPSDIPPCILKLLHQLDAIVEVHNRSLPELRKMVSELSGQNPHQYVFLDPWSDGENPMAYMETLAEELWQETNGSLSAIIAPADTCGCLMGCSTGLKIHDPEILAAAAVLEDKDFSYGTSDPEGPADPELYVPQLTDCIFRCPLSEAQSYQELLWQQEGILCGPSGGAALWAAGHIKTEKEGSIAVILPSRFSFY